VDHSCGRLSVISSLEAVEISANRLADAENNATIYTPT